MASRGGISAIGGAIRPSRTFTAAWKRIPKSTSPILTVIKMASLFSVITSKRYELEMHNPALCEELRVRDILDNVGVMTNGTFVAAYELSGVHSYYHTEEMRNRAKESLEAVLRSMPERSMRLHLRFEIRQDTGGVIDRYAEAGRHSNTILSAIDRERSS